MFVGYLTPESRYFSLIFFSCLHFRRPMKELGMVLLIDYNNTQKILGDNNNPNLANFE